MDVGLRIIEISRSHSVLDITCLGLSAQVIGPS